MRLLVYEHMSGGGYAGQPIPTSVLTEGFGMLRTVVSDFKAAGHQVTVLLDARISRYNPPLSVDCTVPVFYPQEPRRFLARIAKLNHAVYIIAPETGQTLQSLVELTERVGTTSLNCEAKVIQKVASKAVLYGALKKNALPTPETLFLNNNGDLAEIKHAIQSKLSYPLIFKPLDGVSCGGLSIVKNESQIHKAVQKIKSESSSTQFIVQEQINGQDVSVSLLCVDGKAFPVSLNKQNIAVGMPEEASSYMGGCVPFDHPLKHEAFRAVERVVGSFTGLRGYVGVDLVLTGQKAFVVDVNPRLTTSYVGLSKVAGFNVAQALIDAVIKGKLPSSIESRGFACFSKIENPSPTVSTLQASYKIEQVVSPPFPISDKAKTSSLITGYGDSVEDAALRLEEAKKHLLNITS